MCTHTHTQYTLLRSRRVTVLYNMLLDYIPVVIVTGFVPSSGVAAGSCDAVDESGNTSSSVSPVTSLVTESGMIFCNNNNRTSRVVEHY